MIFTARNHCQRMNKPELTNPRIAAALAVAAVADLLQFPITGLTATGFLTLPGEFADFVVDCLAMGAITMLLGFHWLLLPSLFVELVPGLDLLPTWTGCVTFLIWRRKREQTTPAHPVVEVQEVQIEPPPLLAAKASLPPPPPGLDAAQSIEARLGRLNDLWEKKVITQAEYDAKRRQVLDDL